jgi:MFS family permease
MTAVGEQTNTVSDSKVQPQPTLDEDDQPTREARRGLRFYAIFSGLCLINFLIALDTTIVGLALPSISASLNAGENYIWAVNAYYLTMAVAQPLTGQLADFFGRRGPTLASLALFTLGSGLCGGTSSIEMLIAGRVIQGLGGGAMAVLSVVLIADLVPLRSRPRFLAFTMAFFAIGTFIGPVLSGSIISGTSWRWVWYINLPICGVAMVVFAVFLRVHRDRDRGSVRDRLVAIDWSGNALLSATVVSILLALTWGGTLYPWTSFQVLVPILVGGGGLVLYALHQRFIASSPTIPFRIFKNPTSLIGLLLVFFHGIFMTWIPFALPIYFQTLKKLSPLDAAVNCLPVVAPFAPAGIVAGLFIQKTGRYKPTLLAGSILMPVSAGCLTLLDVDTSKAVYVVIQLVAGIAIGTAFPCTLPAIQAPLAEEDVAAATATSGFLRAFGFIWGAAIPSAVFNSRFDSLLWQISDPAVRTQVAHGGAYEHGTRAFLSLLDEAPQLQAEVLGVYAAAMKQVWQVYIAFGAITVPLALAIPEVALRTRLETKYGLKSERQTK